MFTVCAQTVCLGALWENLRPVALLFVYNLHAEVSYFLPCARKGTSSLLRSRKKIEGRLHAG